MKILKIVDKTKTLKSKKSGKEYNPTYYAIEWDNGKRTYINPVYDNGYSELDFNAQVVVKK